MRILQIESELDEIVKLVGVDALSYPDRLILEAARSIREDYLQQNAFLEDDAYASLKKQARMLKIVMAYYKKAAHALDEGASFFDLISIPVRDRIGLAKQTPQAEADKEFDEIEIDLNEQINLTLTADNEYSE